MSDARMPDQRSLLDQLTDLVVIANQKGMYDAADFLLKKISDYTHEAADLYRGR